jgi:capsule polysaccharide modification protein KpsS
MRPYQRLPVPLPCDHDPGPNYFYNNFVSHFIPDMIKMVNTGLAVDSSAVEDLRTLIDEVQETVYERLGKHPYVVKYQETCRRPKAQREHEEDATKSVRTLDHYLKSFKETDMTHRTWLVNTHLQDLGLHKDVRDKWTVKDVKEYNIFLNDAFLSSVIDKRISPNSTTAVKAMRSLAEYKLELWNRPRYEKKKQKVSLEAFNPNSAKQTCEIFQMLKIPAKAYSKDTGEPSWGRDQIEELRKQ